MTDLLLSPAVEARLPTVFPAACHNLSVAPHWLDAGRFWYRREGATGVEYLLVEAATGEKRAAFDGAAVAAALQDEAAFAALEITSVEGETIGLAQGRRRWLWRGDVGQLESLPARPHADDESLSPDGKWVLSRREGDLWLRPALGGAERRLTDTGAPHFEWAKSPDQSLETILIARRGLRLPPIALWSPDSRKIFTYQLDERAVRRVPIVQNVPEDGSFAPKLYEMRNAFAGDTELPIAHQAVIEIETGRIIPCGPADVTETSGLEKREAWWSGDSGRVFWLEHDRYEREITLVETDSATGAARRVISERAETFVEVNLAYGAMPNIRVLDGSGELVWFSQRDGFAHLYLCDLATGAVKAQITKGDWPVVELLGVDTAQRQVIFLAGAGEGAADPYQRRVCVAGLDGGAMRVLTPEPGDHAPVLRDLGWAEILEANGANGPLASGLSPDGGYIVVTTADAARLGQSWLCRVADGARVAELEQGGCDLPLVLPERVELLAADGLTRLFGMLWRPRDFDPARQYPLLDLVYPGPQCIQAPRAALPHDELTKIAWAQAASAAGMAVLMMDGRGTPYRSRAFHELCHGNLADPGFLSDHVAAFPQLGAGRPWLDLTRIAIMGHSAGGHAAARGILAWPEVYKVAVSTAGSHELRSYNRCWPEKWQGELIRYADGSSNYDSVANALLADRLQGHLLLGHGDMDENVLPSTTLQLAKALELAGKNFDLLLTPNDDHASFKSNPWVIRRILRYLTQKLGCAVLA
ncbi:DPP IV N-terminal domain-containing protein [Xinfangfangia sp. CPCC 101601]|uniref:DPP IV N-terminal domain-containing protein n=1 Tax=Pseudogemmobacter lacusdianii TaxID=3069608 RepID=A0ABU0VV37_9RHOB|nr:DPP IV N-terminal domain-containing protein [Xinfangfangia sp. CPCC 101601]MDQ2065125.1 DPP IV N-terminal domain-containing protein [Xinfangfangia sp. CPCC 101601]